MNIPNPAMRRRTFLRGSLGLAAAAALADVSSWFLVPGDQEMPVAVETDEQEAIRASLPDAPQIVLPDSYTRRVYALDSQMIPDRDDTRVVQMLLDRAGAMGRATMPRDGIWRVHRDLLLSGGTLDLNGGTLELVIGDTPLLLKPRPLPTPGMPHGSLAHVGPHCPATVLTGAKALTSGRIDRNVGTIRQYFRVRSAHTNRKPAHELGLGEGTQVGDLRLANSAVSFAVQYHAEMAASEPVPGRPGEYQRPRSMIRPTSTAHGVNTGEGGSGIANWPIVRRS